MRKKLLLLITSVLSILGLNAQVADLANGYYRVHNHHTDRYIYILDNKGSLDYSNAKADMGAIALYMTREDAISDPASILYFEKHDPRYDITAQSTGIYQMIGTYVSIVKSRTQSDAYYAYGSKSGVVMYLIDSDDDLEEYASTLDAKPNLGSTIIEKLANWHITPINNNTDNYFGVKPTLQAGGKYYEPFYADFPFSFASSGMKAYYVTKVDEKNGYAIYAEVNGTVPRSTPVFIECSSAQPSANKLNIGGNGTAISDNKLTGVYFNFHKKKHENYVAYDKKTMRSLGVLSDGSIGLIAGNYEYVPKNSFYLKVSTSCPANLKLVTQEEYDRLVVAEPVYPTGITLSSTSLTLTIGDTHKLNATVKPDDTTDKSVTWTSSNPSVVSVDAQGNLTTVAIGAATITAKCQNVSATCQVTVQGIQATSVTLNQTSLNLIVGETSTLTATVAPANTTDKTISWSSSNSAVAKVNSNGVVTAVSKGTATITAKCSSVSATCQVTVSTIEATSVTLNVNTLNLKIGQTSTLTATVAPDNATDKTVTWSSSDATVASVSNGKVTALKVGAATITAKCGSVQATCQVTVTPIEAESVTLNKTSVTLQPGETTSLTASVAPSNTTDKTVTWMSSNTNVATVSANGLITAKAEGEAVITATCGNVKAECSVTVRKVLAESVTLNTTSVTLQPGETAELTASVAPNNTFDKTVTWTSSNTSIATVTEDGQITAVAEGEAIITASCGPASADCKVTVRKVVAESVTLNKTSITMHIGESQSITATVRPTNTYDKTVVWTSSDESVATVSSNGIVVAKGFGTAIITASCGDASATCNVSVVPIEAESVSLNMTQLNLLLGQSEALVATVAPSNTTDSTVTWSTSDDDVATVDQYGKVTATGVGEAIITATCGSVSATCAVTVRPIIAESVTLDKTSVELLIGTTTSLTATVYPSNTTDKTLVWSSSDESVATVDQNGTITAVSLGVATITVSCGEASASCRVTVTPVEAASISISQTSADLYVGDEITLIATVLPENTTDCNIVWASSDESVVTVSRDGVVKAIEIGNATVTATCGNVSATCSVTVLPIEATEVILDKTNVEVEVGSMIELTATVVPDNATDKTVTWASSDTNIVTVDDQGVITAVGVGTATVIATCGNASAVCSVTVMPVLAVEVILDKTEIEIDLWEETTAIITATVVPDNATDKTVVWTTSDADVATVDADGVVTGIAVGTATITATCGEVSASCEVKVIDSNGICDVVVDADGPFDVFNVQGMLVKVQATDLKGLRTGVYIVNGVKYFVK